MTKKLDTATKTIKKDMDSLFAQLDALSHYQFRPPMIKPEVKIVSNMPSFRAEEVGPLASAEPNSSLLAPEEVFPRAKTAPVADDELTQTDRKRMRRHKKNKQRILQQAEEENADEPNTQTEHKRIHRRKEKKQKFLRADEVDSLVFAELDPSTQNDNSKPKIRRKEKK